MQIDSLKLSNFMSFHEAELSFPDNGLALIEGRNLDEGDSNGSGKSSLWDAISWCLFGHTVRGLKAAEVVHRKFKKDCVVEVSLRSRGRNFKVIRAKSHKDFGDAFFYEMDGKRVQQGTLAMTQEALLRELGIDFELFRCTVLFAQEETFNFVAASNKEQKEILSKVMRIDYDEFLQKAKDAVREIEDGRREAERKIEVLESHRADPEELYKNDLESWNAQHHAESHAIKLELNNSQLELSSLVVQDVAKLEEVLNKLHKAANDGVQSVDAVAHFRSEHRTKLEVAQAELNRIKALTDAGQCPTCGQAVSDHSADVADLKARVAKEEQIILKCDAKNKATKERLYEFDEKIALVNRKLSTVRAASVKAEKIRSRMEALTERLSAHSLKKNPWHAKIAEAKAKQAEIDRKLAELAERKTTLDARLPYAAFWVNAFGDSGIKSFVFDLICAALTNKTNHYLSILTSGSVIVTFDTQKKLKTGGLREKFDCEIISNGQRVPYEAYSGGEKRRISLAVDMALSDTMREYYGESFNLVVFDEQTNYLDRKGRNNFMNLLRETAEKRCVFVVDHDGEFKARFDRSITVEKKAEISRIV